MKYGHNGSLLRSRITARCLSSSSPIIKAKAYVIYIFKEDRSFFFCIHFGYELDEAQKNDLSFLLRNKVGTWVTSLKLITLLAEEFKARQVGW